MNWNALNQYGDSFEKSFEAMCNQLFDRWCKRTYDTKIKYFTVVNGNGGDGGVEAYCELNNEDIIGVQSKGFRNPIGDSQINQIKKSIMTAKRIRPNLKKYIVCIPRSLGSKKTNTKTSEEDRWIKLKLDMEEEFQDLELILWTEDAIRDEIQKDISGGILRYWFNKEDISIDIMKSKFDRNKKSWLKAKYISSLHGKGKISHISKVLMDNKIIREKNYVKLCENLKFINKSIEDIKYYKEIYDNEELEATLCKLLILLNELKINTEEIMNCVKHSFLPSKLQVYTYPNIYECMEAINSQAKTSLYNINLTNLKKIIERLNEGDIEITIEKAYKSLNLRSVMVVGDPGTGKTHGLSNVLEQHLLDGKPGVIIQAKKYTERDSWKDIMIDTLGLSNNWAEEEIWNALEACTYRIDKNLKNYKHINDNILDDTTKVLICLDGLDESIPYKHWIDKINEIEEITTVHSRIRFLISSRPYVLKNKTINCKAIRLNSDGDVKVSDIFSKYIDTYNVRIIKKEDFNYLKWAIKTPLDLRIFCEIYENKPIYNIDKVNCTTDKLIAKKIYEIDREIRTKLGDIWLENDQVILKILIGILPNFIEDLYIERKSLYNLISIKQDFLDANIVFKIIESLVDYGILQEYKKENEDPLSPYKVEYEMCIQPIIDYLLARSIVENIVKEGNLKFPHILQFREGSQQMCSVILLQDHDLLIGDNNLWSDNLVEEDILELRLFALSNIKADKAIKYKEYIINTIKHSMPVCRMVVNKLIAKVARIPNHPLGPIMLHEWLISYEKIAHRDKLWSLPKDMSNVYDWYGGFGKAINESEEFNLKEDDLHTGLPLIYAWQLTIVDNSIRQQSRKALTEWGISNTPEFIKLIKLTFRTNDMQMKEDLMCCAYGVASKLNTLEDLKMLSEFVLEEVFAEEKIIHIRSAIVRGAARFIAERGYLFNVVGTKDLDKSRPPYNVGGIYIDSKSFIEDNENDIHFGWDMVRYVIPKGYTKFFHKEYNWEERSSSYDDVPLSILKKYSKLDIDSEIKKEVKYIVNEKEKPFELNLGEDNIQLEKQIKYNYSNEAEELLNEYAKKNDLNDINPKEFAKSFVKNYIINTGWNIEEFEGKPNGGKPGEIIGVDTAIYRKYYAATHGNKSRVMTLKEKYIWCAVNEMIGYLADRLPAHIDSGEGEENTIVDDYMKLLNICNPVQDLYVENTSLMRKNAGWYIPSDISPSIDTYLKPSKEDVLGWIRDCELPNFNDWIIADTDKIKFVDNSLDGDWVCIHNFTDLYEAKTKGESILWINSCIIKEEDFNYFKYDLMNKNEELLKSLDNPSLIYSSPDVNSEIDPMSICWMTWIKDLYPTIDLYTLNEKKIIKYNLYKCLSEISYSLEDEYLNFNIPSKIIREMCGITHGDGWRYYNKDNKLIAFFSECGEHYMEYQSMLYINKNILEDALNSNGYKMIWTVRLLREASMSVRDRYNNFFPQLDRNFIIYNDESKLINVQFSNIELDLN